MAIRLVLADDHPVFLMGLETLLQAEDDFEILATCLDGEETLSAVRKHNPDILVLDMRMPGLDGLAVLRRLRKEKINTNVVLLTATMDDEQLAEAVRLGVRGLVLKALAAKLIVQCLRQVHAGELWLEQRSVTRALEKLLQTQAARQEAAQVLTRREIDVVKLVALGLHNAEVAQRLYISEGTVKMHLHNIYEKLHLHSRIELSRYAREKGLD